MKKQTHTSLQTEVLNGSLQEQLNVLQAQLSELQAEKAAVQLVHNQLIKQIRLTKTKWAKIKKALHLTPPSIPQPLDLSISIDIEMVFVEGGTFKMGSRDYANERPIHFVTLDSFWIGKYPVTQPQWEAVLPMIIRNWLIINFLNDWF
jgi:formylglycine-generating enzyme required for sulfatase activity